MPSSLPYRAIALLTLGISLSSCDAGRRPRSPPPEPFGEVQAPPPRPGHSITSGKACECRACDPSRCCSAEHLESAAASSPECNASYEFSEKCGITVQTCTPRCYAHVWRIPKEESCSASRPLVCCN